VLSSKPKVDKDRKDDNKDRIVVTGIDITQRFPESLKKLIQELQ
jgi:hypothetical protein